VTDVKVEIKGLKEVNAALQAYGKDLGNNLELIVKATAQKRLKRVNNLVIINCFLIEL